MHLQKIRSWLFRPQDDLRPISWIIGGFIACAIMLVAFFGPIAYLDNYSGTMPVNYLTAVLILCSGAAITSLVLWGHLMLVAIDVLFDICYLIKRHRSS